MNNGIHGQWTNCPKMGADKLAESTPNALKLPNLPDQAQKLWISIKKASLGVRSPWLKFHNFQLLHITLCIQFKGFENIFERRMKNILCVKSI